VPAGIARAWSQWPLEDGRRSPSGVAIIAATFRLTDVSDEPMKITGS